MAQFFRNVFCEYQMCTGATDERAHGSSILSDNSLDRGTPAPGRPAFTRSSILKPLKAKASKLRTWGDYNYTFKLQT